MKVNIEEMEFWEFGALGIHNPAACSLSPYFALISTLERIEGDVLELGVARGNSLITTGLILQGLQSPKSVIGVDTFSGFPGSTLDDEFSSFANLCQNGTITNSH